VLTSKHAGVAMPWIYAADCVDLSDHDVIGVECSGRRLAVFRLEDGYFATSDVCPHQGGALSRGCVVENFVECPLHFALFDIRTGEADGGVTTRSVRTFATKVEDGRIYIDLDT
jgi:nitrite reductase/ring-hydroxylating ferredoxin subunit